MMTESGGVFVPNAQTSRCTPPSSSRSNENTCVSSPDGVSKSEIPTSKNFSNNTDLTQVATKIESLKKWTVNTYKTTKHSINEQLGKVKKTVDKDLEERIEALRDLQRRYKEILAFSRGFTNHFHQANNLQRILAETIYQLSCKEDVLNNEFALHSEVLRGVSQNGELLFNALNSFISALETITDKTIQDTLITIDCHDQARLEYDAYRCELENLRTQPNASSSSLQLTELEEKCNELKRKYEQLKEDIRVKLTLLEENRCKVMRRQIAVIQQAFVAYHSGSIDALQSAVSRLKDSSDVSINSSFHNTDPMRPSSRNAIEGERSSSFLEQ